MWYLIFLLMIGQGGQTIPVTDSDGQVTIQDRGDEGEAGTILPPKPPVKP